MRPAEALPQLNARSFIDGERLTAEVKTCIRSGAVSLPDPHTFSIERRAAIGKKGAGST